MLGHGSQRTPWSETQQMCLPVSHILTCLGKLVGCNLNVLEVPMEPEVTACELVCPASSDDKCIDDAKDDTANGSSPASGPTKHLHDE